MHTTALRLGEAFLHAHAREGDLVVDVGAYDINGSLRSVTPPGARYLGLDMAPGPGVDVVVDPTLPLPLGEGSADLVVASSAFEHDGAFWLTFLELVRITKPGGLIYLNVPSNGHVHRHPEDCWRFYPDAGVSLERWARRQGRSVTLVESFVADRQEEFWNDFVAVFYKGETPPMGTWTLLSDNWPASNIRRFGATGVMNPREPTEDMILLEQATAELASLKQPPAVPSAFGPPIAAASSGHAIDHLDGVAFLQSAAVNRGQVCSLDGWLWAEGFDPSAPGAVRYLVLQHADQPAVRLIAPLGEALPRPDVRDAHPETDPRFSLLSGFSQRFDFSQLQTGRYRLGFAMADAAGTRLRMDERELLIG